MVALPLATDFLCTGRMPVLRKGGTPSPREGGCPCYARARWWAEMPAGGIMGG